MKIRVIGAGNMLLRDPQALSGKVLFDCNNSDIMGLDVPSPRAPALRLDKEPGRDHIWKCHIWGRDPSSRSGRRAAPSS
jgi:hypothetical protein